MKPRHRFWSSRTEYMAYLLEQNCLDFEVIQDAAAELGLEPLVERQRLKPIRPPEEGKACVYVIRASNGLYKIGSSRQVDKRLSNLQTSTPLTLDLVYVIPTGQYLHTALERTLHYLLAGKRKQGEWFALDDSDLASLSALAENSH